MRADDDCVGCAAAACSAALRAAISALQPRLGRGPRPRLARRLLRLELVRSTSGSTRAAASAARAPTRVCCFCAAAALTAFARASRFSCVELLLARSVPTCSKQSACCPECRVLLRQHLRRLGAVDDLREALRAGDDVDACSASRSRRGSRGAHEPLLRGVEVPSRDVEPVLVLPQARLDQLEPLLRARTRWSSASWRCLPIRSTCAMHGALVRLRGADLRRRVSARHGRRDRREARDERAPRSDETVTSHRKGDAKSDPKPRR